MPPETEHSPANASAVLRGLHNLQRGVGEVALLLAHHPEYGSLFLGDLKRRVVPPVLLNQCKIVRDRRERTVGFVSWALVNERVRQKLMDGVFGLRPADWRCGDSIVIMDAVAPSPAATDKIVVEVAETQFAGQKVWKALGGRIVKPGLASVEVSARKA